MAEVTESQVLSALKAVIDPEQKQDIVSLGLVSGVTLNGGQVALVLSVDPARGKAMEPVRKAAEAAVKALPGVSSASVVLTAERAPTPAEAAKAEDAPLLPQVKSIVAVASGKGGVGKSTTAVNIALALSHLGMKVGLFDADIYGPSLPRMLGLAGQQPESVDGQTLQPMEAFGIKCMSIGFLVEEDMPIIWRGPMVMGALQQLMRDVAWGELDVMIVDMPPGTGDTQLTMTQSVPLTGAVIVSTPQDIALLDARKGLNMFRKVDVPVLGVVENMSYYVCPKCGDEAHIFGHGGAKVEAARLSCDFLGEVPLDIAIRETSDLGHPIVVSQPTSPHAEAYLSIARKIAEKLEVLQGGGKKGPKIRFA